MVAPDINTFFRASLLAGFLMVFCIQVSAQTRGTQRPTNPGSNPEIIVRTYPNNVRIIPPGKGEVYSEDFVKINQFHFVQFAVYNIEKNWREIRAPKIPEQLWLIEHPNTIVQGTPYIGAYYIVRPCNSLQEAQNIVAKYKNQGIDCFYNRELSNISFVILAFNTM